MYRCLCNFFKGVTQTGHASQNWKALCLHLGVCIFITSGITSVRKFGYLWCCTKKKLLAAVHVSVDMVCKTIFRVLFLLPTELFVKAGSQEQGRFGRNLPLWEWCFWFQSIYHHKHYKHDAHEGSSECYAWMRNWALPVLQQRFKPWTLFCSWLVTSTYVAMIL